MQISAIKSIENIAENPEECERSSGYFLFVEKRRLPR